ncbi:MAG: 2-C-methyl-D-erythritol 4-phosphate cytidylyltransferase [Oxalobacter sp.]|jgi:2-C-methyl-D-erythritol 4-phosphate cytidylyltransferase|nr:MAG: 2-C-methyl-D-erythritol 4-phosphate cytidylyltransferase [Oxalobacter sp.]
MKSPRYFALIPAAGVGARMGADLPKQYLPIGGKPMISHALASFLAHPDIARVFVVVSENDDWIDKLLAQDRLAVTVLRCGGATRRDSVLNGLRAMREQVAPEDWVLVHDAARPGITPELIGKLMTVVGDDPVGGLLAMPVTDTVKRDENGRMTTVPRDGLWLAQTPQMFRYASLRRALQLIPEVTDEASAMEAVGLTPKLVEGHVRNSKVTRPADKALVELFFKP